MNMQKISLFGANKGSIQSSKRTLTSIMGSQNSLVSSRLSHQTRNTNLEKSKSILSSKRTLTQRESDKSSQPVANGPSDHESIEDFENYVKCKKEPTPLKKEQLKVITNAPKYMTRKEEIESACKEIESACKEMRSANKLQRKITSRSVDSPSPIKGQMSDSELEDVFPNSPLKSPYKLELGLSLKKQNSEKKWWEHSATMRKSTLGGHFRSQMQAPTFTRNKSKISSDNSQTG